jgi:hypothetical protein
VLLLFKKIRKQLIKNKKITKYLLYAMSEIVLVVIGILIAVNINNWNEDQKKQANLRSGLVSLKEDLAQDILLVQQILPFITDQLELNESLRKKIAHQDATADTLVKIARFEFDPSWNEPMVYNMNAYNSLSSSELVDLLNDPLGYQVKSFYNRKATKINATALITNGYRNKIASYLETYAFGSTRLHDQGPLIDSLIWNDVDLSHLAAAFQGLSNYKRILFETTKAEMDFTLTESKALIQAIELHLAKRASEE